MFSFRSAVLGLAVAATAANAQFTSYISQFLRVNYTVEGGFDESTKVAQDGVVMAAKWFSAQGPWSVRDKAFTAPTNDPHDYLSWSPYWWPNCANAGNTTELTPQQIWTDCVYYQRDGLFNPDVRQVNDTGEFQAMSDAVFYNTLAYRITGENSYAEDAARFIDTWFINNATFMNPNLNFAQVQRGATGSQGGTHTGILDLHHISKVTSAVLILRALGAPAWTNALDTALNNWSIRYIEWLKTARIALEEKAAANNHGSFYFSQLASIQVMVGDYAGARETIQEYFSGIYQDQITANGEQPLEAARTRPYHYRAYNTAAIITINRVAEYMGWDTWNMTSKEGATVQDAIDFAMDIPPGNDRPEELYPNVAAMAVKSGDPTGKYAAWLAEKDPTYPAEPFFFFEQPLSDSGIKVHLDESGNPQLGPAPTNAGGSKGNGSGGESAASSLSMPLFSLVTASLVALLGITL